MKKKILFQIKVITVLLFMLISCTPDNKKDVYLILKTTNNPFFTDMLDGAKQRIGGRYELIVKSGKREDDIESQMQALQLIIDESKSPSNDIAGVILTPTSSKGELVPFLKQLKDKNIPVVLVDTKILDIYLKQGGIDSIPFVSSSNIEGGRQAGRIIMSSTAVTKGGEILILNGIDGQENAGTRNKGFHEIADTSFKHPILTERTANWNRDEALSVTSGLISTGKRFEAIFAANDEMALGALQAILNGNITPKPIIVGFDAIDEAKKAVAKKQIVATIAQNPFKMGEVSIDMLYAIIDKKSIPYTYLIPTEIVDK